MPEPPLTGGADVTDPPKTDPKPPPTPNRPADKAPKKKGPGRPKGSKNKPRAGSEPKPRSEGSGIAKLRRELDGLFKSPGFAFEAIGEKWPAEHVDKQGAVLAAEIADYADKNPAFRARLEAFLTGGETTKLIFAGLMYVAPLGIYFGVIPAPDRIRVVMNIPQRQRQIVELPDIPPAMREQVETEAKENGFVTPDGGADIPAFMEHVRQTVEAMREGGPQNGV